MVRLLPVIPLMPLMPLRPSGTPVRALGCLWSLCLCVALCMQAGPCRAEASEAGSAATAADVTEAQVKAAYLHKFAGFVEWPVGRFASPTAPFLVVVVGSDAVYAELARIAPGRTVQGRAVEVSRLPASAGLPTDAHVVYLGSAMLEAAHALGLRNSQVLTVADAPWGYRAGAVLTFIEEDGRLRFDASLKAAEHAGIRLSARLLGVARRVLETTP